MDEKTRPLSENSRETIVKVHVNVAGIPDMTRHGITRRETEQ